MERLLRSELWRPPSLPSRGVLRTHDIRPVKVSDAEKMWSPQNWDPCHQAPNPLILDFSASRTRPTVGVPGRPLPAGAVPWWSRCAPRRPCSLASLRATPLSAEALLSRSQPAAPRRARSHIYYHQALDLRRRGARSAEPRLQARGLSAAESADWDELAEAARPLARRPGKRRRRTAVPGCPRLWGRSCGHRAIGTLGRAGRR